MLGVCTMMRDSMRAGTRDINHVHRFFKQIQPLNPDKYFIIEGDSKDNTYEVLCKYKRELKNIELIKCNLGGEVASRVCDARFKRLSTLANMLLGAVKRSDCTALLYIESDFIIEDGQLQKLLQFVDGDLWGDSLAVCAVPFIQNKGSENRIFYDTWAYEALDGTKFGSHEMDKFTESNVRYLPMKSFGSCVLFNVEYLKKFDVSFGESGCFPYACKVGIDNGLKLWCDTTCLIKHPSEHNFNGRLV